MATTAEIRRVIVASPSQSRWSLYQIAGCVERCPPARGSAHGTEGSLQTRSWEDQNGQKRYKTEIKASNVVMLGRREDGMRSASSSPARDVADTPEPATAGAGAYDDDVPF